MGSFITSMWNTPIWNPPQRIHYVDEDGELRMTQPPYSADNAGNILLEDPSGNVYLAGRTGVYPLEEFNNVVTITMPGDELMPWMWTEVSST